MGGVVRRVVASSEILRCSMLDRDPLMPVTFPLAVLPLTPVPVRLTLRHPGGRPLPLLILSLRVALAGLTRT